MSWRNCGTHGSTARTLQPGYATIALPRGLIAYIAELKQ
jgi:hypothetical protein